MPEPPDYLARIARAGDPLSQMDLDICGGRAFQLRFRVEDQLDARRIAALLREFANRLEVYSDPRRFDERAALAAMKYERAITQGKLTRRRKGA